MARCAVFLAVTAVALFSGIAVLGGRHFPVDDCHTGCFDLLLMFSKKYAGEYTIKGDILEEIACVFSNDLNECDFIKVFSSVPDSESTRIKTFKVLDTWGDKCDVVLNTSNGTSVNICHKLSFLASVNYNRTSAIEDVELKVKIAQEILTDLEYGRKNATKIAIILVNHFDFPTLNDDGIQEIQDKLQLQSANIQVLVTVLRHQTGTNSIYHNDMIVSSRCLDVKKVHAMLCKDCPPGWLSLKDKNDFINCYKLQITSRKINWIESMSSCEILKASLVTVESKDELEYLQEQLFVQVLEHRHIIDNISLQDHSVAVYIGLRRDSNTVARLFQWDYLSGFRPLVINHWLPGQPAGGFSHACGVWFYSNILNYSVPLDLSLGNSSTENSLFLDYKSNGSVGWMSVGCGARLSTVSLCEMPRYLKDKHLRRLHSPNKESFHKALNRTDFQEFEGNIVSVSANLNQEKFVHFLRYKNENFPMFDCEEEEGIPRYIAYSYVCDSVDHCTNRRDETACIPVLCTSCLTEQCPHKNGYCSIIKDYECGSHKRQTCPCNGGPCCHGTCLPLLMFNDGQIDFKEYKDNMNHDESSAPDQCLENCAFICNNFQCIYPSQLNDNKTDCTGSEGPLDETIGKLEWANSCSDKLGRPIWAPRCVYVRDRYGTVLGCRDLSHFQNCGDFPCQEGYYKCPGSYCIPINYVLDGKSDCPEGEEEEPVERHSCVGNFACWNSEVCLHPDLVCDGHPDCPNKDDELNCNVSCSRGFRCLAGTITVDKRSQVDQGGDIFLGRSTRYVDLSGLNLQLMDLYFQGECDEIYIFRCSECSITNNITSLVSKIKCKFNRINLSYNSITFVNNFCSISQMLYIRSLNLSFNRNLTIFAESRCRFIEILDLSHTSLLFIEKNSFTDLRNLKHLNLSDTRLMAFHGDMFSPGTTLQTLDLRRAPIEMFTEKTFLNLKITSSVHADNFELCCPLIRGYSIPGQACHVTEDPISSCSHMIGLNVQRILLWLMAGIALLGNLIVVWLHLIKDRAILRTAYGLFMLNLGISDLLMGISILVLVVADGYYRGVYVIYIKEWKESLACKISNFLATFSSEGSIFFLVLLTIDRLVVLRFPHRHVNFSRKTTVMAVVVLSWTGSFLLAVLLVFTEFGDKNTFVYSAICVGLPITKQRLHDREYDVVTVIVLIINFIMFTFAVIGVVGIYKLKSTNTISSEIPNQNSACRAQNIAVVLIDFLCLFPVGLIGFLALSGYEISNEVYAWTVVLIRPVYSAINPLLYTIQYVAAKRQPFHE